MTSIVPIAVLIFLALVMATKIVVGDERIIYYHHEIAVVSGTALFLRVLHQPVLAYLDIAVLGIGLFLACGRVGCLLVGCCHGRPCRWGVRYSENHADAGFTPYYVGIPLFPVQALESLWALMIVAVGAMMVLHGDAPGSALTWYVIAYGLGRFYFEFLRGDPDRPYFGGFSEAQLTSLILMALTVYAETSRALPLRPWHIAVLALVVVTVAVLSIHRRLRSTPTFQLFHPQHIRDVAEALADDARENSQIGVARTSLGIKISHSEIHDGRQWFCHYALSCDENIMSAELAREVANIISLLRHARAHVDLIEGNSGVFHVLAPANSEKVR